MYMLILFVTLLVQGDFPFYLEFNPVLLNNWVGAYLINNINPEFLLLNSILLLNLVLSLFKKYLQQLLNYQGVLIQNIIWITFFDHFKAMIYGFLTIQIYEPFRLLLKTYYEPLNAFNTTTDMLGFNNVIYDNNLILIKKNYLFLKLKVLLTNLILI